MSPNRYRKSEDYLKRALASIPLGSQTFSKSVTQYPHGVSPYFAQKGKGARVWDLDGNEYIDFVSGLASISLGYNDPDVTKAVKNQLEEGTIFSLPHPIEVEVAEKIIEMVPSAEMVRFGKNGSDVTAGAIRIARAWTKRDRVAACGYHGWQDWYIGATSRNEGVPKVVQEMTHLFKYNDIESLAALFKKYPDQFAAVIMEPMNLVEPKGDFLAKVKELAHKNGALLIFDEMITGFRFSEGGAQQYFNVTPDLSAFGKGMANGFPISALVGRADIMKLCERIFFSFTFGGETLSLAAAKAVLTKLNTKPVIKTMRESGEKIRSSVNDLIKKHGLQKNLSLSGHPAWTAFNIVDSGKVSIWDIRTLLLQELLSKGIMSLGAHFVTFSHSPKDIEALTKSYDEIFGSVKQMIDSGNKDKFLKCKTLEPLFSVR